MSEAWARVDAELDFWAASGRKAEFWLRDDDAVAPTEMLDRLLALAAETGAPIAIAVIPEAAKPVLARRLAREPAVSVLQHGYAHANHAGMGAKKAEFPESRPLDAMTADISAGRARLCDLFGKAATPIFAPPWNRIAERLLTHLRECGVAGLSRFKPRAQALAAEGVPEFNAHVDAIDWRGGRTGKPEAALWDEICAHLAAKRTGTADAREPTGLLTHHLAMDDGAWAATAAALRRLAADPRARWRDARDLFGLAQ